MYVSPDVVLKLHNDRLREFEKRNAEHLLRDINEPMPNVVEAGLIVEIRQWMRSRKQTQQEIVDVRPVPAC